MLHPYINPIIPKATIMKECATVMVLVVVVTIIAVVLQKFDSCRRFRFPFFLSMDDRPVPPMDWCLLRAAPVPIVLNYLLRKIATV